MFENVWEGHEVGEGLLFIDLHLVHEVTSAQAFDGLRLAGRTLRRPDRTLATADHNVPTGPGEADELSRRQLEALTRNCKEFGVPLYPLGHGRQGIVHVIGPELGVTQPGMTIVCGDSHTSRTAPSARWPSASAPARSSTCWPRRHWCSGGRRRCWSSIAASLGRDAPPRTSCSARSPRSAPTAAPAT